MIQAKQHFKAFLNRSTGGGGFKCPCCAPKKEGARTTVYRSIKRGERNKFWSEEMKLYNE